MITNEKQYKITKKLLKKIQDAIDDIKSSKKDSIESDILVKAELDALLSEEKIIKDQISEYEKLKSGGVKIFKASSLEELPLILIKARISKRLSQKDLAKLVGIKEQQIQRYEASEYSSASLKRLSQVAKALDLTIKEIAEFKKSKKDSSTDSIGNIKKNKFLLKEILR